MARTAIVAGVSSAVVAVSATATGGVLMAVDKVTCVVCTVAPLVPVTVNGNVPRGVDGDVFTVIVDVPDPVTEAGVKVAVAPVGRPVTLNATAPLKPPFAVIVIV